MSNSTVKIVRFHETGGPEVLKIEEMPLPQPGPGEVRLRVQAIGLNRAEVMYRKGQYLVSPVLPSTNGYEAAGVVEAVGPDVDKRFLNKKFSTVPCFNLGTYGVYGEAVIVPVYALAEYPENLSPSEATSIWMQYITAYGALIHYGQMKRGDFVMMTAASSSVGIAAIEIAKAEGAVSIAVTRKAAKREALLALGADHVIVTDEENIAKRVNEITSCKGARLIFDPVGGKGLEHLAEAASQHAIIFEYGVLAPEPTPFPLFAALAKGLTVRGYTLFEILAQPDVRQSAQKYIFDRLKNGSLKPVIAKTFTLANIVDAHRYMESNEQFGKIVVTV